MDHQFEQTMAALHERQRREIELMHALSDDEREARLDEFMLAIGPEAGRFINLLIKTAGAHSVLELGTSVGYSTLWMAEAVRSTGGHIISFDPNPDKHRQAWDHLRAAGLAAHVELRTEDAMEALPHLEGPFDFVLIDLWKRMYVPCFQTLYPNKLAAGGIVVADNMLYPESARPRAEEYRKCVHDSPGMETVLVPIGSGLEFSRRSSE